MGRGRIKGSITRHQPKLMSKTWKPERNGVPYGDSFSKTSTGADRNFRVSESFEQIKKETKVSTLPAEGEPCGQTKSWIAHYGKWGEDKTAKITWLRLSRSDAIRTWFIPDYCYEAWPKVSDNASTSQPSVDVEHSGKSEATLSWEKERSEVKDGECSTQEQDSSEESDEEKTRGEPCQDLMYRLVPHPLDPSYDHRRLQWMPEDRATLQWLQQLSNHEGGWTE